MSAHYYIGDDNRDELTDPEPEQRCQDCNAGEDEPCRDDCGCYACRARAARIQDHPKDAA